MGGGRALSRGLLHLLPDLREHDEVFVHEAGEEQRDQADAEIEIGHVPAADFVPSHLR